MSKAELLEAVAKEVIECKNCTLSKTRRNAVPGEGSPDSKVMFVGEAPGQSEDIKGEPFVGAAGQFLDELLTRIGLSRSNVFITNIVKCRPPRNREPKPSEVEACTPYLNRQIELIQPEFLVTLGSHSTAYVFSRAGLSFSSITKVHGKPCEATVSDLKLAVFPTFHPAAALYYPKYKDQLIADFKVLKNELVKKKVVSQ